MSKINGTIWTFHRISPARDEAKIHFFDNNYNVYPDVLEYYIVRSLAQNYRFLSLSEFLKNKQNKTGSEKDICITIDDGGKDIYTYAFPIFKKYNIPFTFFVNVGFINEGFQSCNFPEFEATQLFFDYINSKNTIKLDSETIKTSTIKEKQDAFFKLWNYYTQQRELGVEPIKIIETITQTPFDFENYHKKYACTWEDIINLSKDSLCTIGSHCVHHNKLIDLNETDLEKELKESRDYLSEKIKKPIDYISYPYGLHNDLVVNVTQKYYKAACAILVANSDRRYVKRSDNIYLLPRKTFICAELLDLLLPHKKQKLKLPWLNNRFIKIFFKVRCKNNEVYYRICGIKVKVRTKI